MTIFIGAHHHYHHFEENSSIIKHLKTIMKKIEILTQEVADLKDAQAQLQDSIDAEQAQIQALLDSSAAVVQAQEQHIADLDTQIEALKAQQADSGTPEQFQSVIDGLEAVKASIAATKADVESTVADASTTTTTEAPVEESTTSSTTEETTVV